MISNDLSSRVKLVDGFDADFAVYGGKNCIILKSQSMTWRIYETYVNSMMLSTISPSTMMVKSFWSGYCPDMSVDMSLKNEEIEV